MWRCVRLLVTLSFWRLPPGLLGHRWLRQWWKTYGVSHRRWQRVRLRSGSGWRRNNRSRRQRTNRNERKKYRRTRRNDRRKRRKEPSRSKYTSVLFIGIPANFSKGEGAKPCLSGKYFDSTQKNVPNLTIWPNSVLSTNWHFKLTRSIFSQRNVWQLTLMLCFFLYYECYFGKFISLKLLGRQWYC